MSWLVAIAVALAGKLMLSEVEGWRCRVASWLVSAAVCALPVNLRERYREEWLACVNEYADRPVSQLAVATGLVVAAWRIDHERRFPGRPVALSVLFRFLDVAIAAPMLVFFLPAIAIVQLFVLATRRSGDRTPLLTRGAFIGRDLELIDSYVVNPKSRVYDMPRLYAPVSISIKLWLTLRGRMSIIGGPAVAPVDPHEYRGWLQEWFAVPPERLQRIAKANARGEALVVEIEELRGLYQLRPGVICADFVLAPSSASDSFAIRYSLSRWLLVWCGFFAFGARTMVRDIMRSGRLLRRRWQRRRRASR